MICGEGVSEAGQGSFKARERAEPDSQPLNHGAVDLPSAILDKVTARVARAGRDEGSESVLGRDACSELSQGWQHGALVTVRQGNAHEEDTHLLRMA